MDLELAKERILEAASLTDQLEDDAADWLINWAIERLAPLIAGIDDDEVAGQKLTELMGLMRSLNKITGGRADKSAEALAKDIRAFMERASALFGAPDVAAAAQAGPSPVDVDEVAAALPGLSPIDALQRLAGMAAPSIEPIPPGEDIGGLPHMPDSEEDESGMLYLPREDEPTDDAGET